MRSYDDWLNDSVAYENFTEGPLPKPERDVDREIDIERELFSENTERKNP